MIVDEAGQQSPAPVGEHELADGTKIVLDEAGTILELEVPEADKVEEEIIPDAPAEPSAEELMKKKIEEMQKQLDEIKMSYEDLTRGANGAYPKGKK